MSFETTFRVFAYAAVLCGFLAIWVSGTFGFLGTGLFFAIWISGWFLEETRWHLSERVGTALILASIPIFYLLWRIGFFAFSSAETMLPGILARLILTLTAIKLFQTKSERDWIFLFIMSFFEVLLAAGMSISALYFAIFIAFVALMATTIILFEIRKTDRRISEGDDIKLAEQAGKRLLGFRPARLPIIGVVLVLVIGAAAGPIFFVLPRTGGAGLGGSGGGNQVSSGFSDRVELGGIGRIKQNDAVVMRVRFEPGTKIPSDIHWRGIALDAFDNHSWSRTNSAIKEAIPKGEKELIQVDYATTRDNLSLSTVYLEPLDSPVLFVMPRAVGVQGNFPFLFRDQHDSFTFQRSSERTTYKLVSETELPELSLLREDNAPYSETFQRYLQLPSNLDPRIGELAQELTLNSGNRYDAAQNIERYLQNDLGYTLELKAGGSQPIADFLFNVRQGHCEYFASSMAIMLRTQGIATRVVNGFQRGEYNETADAFVIRQKDAHSWVEVYFPETKTWVPFDPTPFAGQGDYSATTGLTASVGKYIEALEMMWIQYFVAFDNQEQRSLFTSVRRGVSDYQFSISAFTNEIGEAIKNWWKDIRGDRGFDGIADAIWRGAVFAAAVPVLLILFWALRRISLKWLMRKLGIASGREPRASQVEFYQRMERLLAQHGLVRKAYETPMEFASAIEMAEASAITQVYNRVRFGEAELTRDESAAIEDQLSRLIMQLKSTRNVN